MVFLGLRKLRNICCGHKMFLNKISHFLYPGHRICVRSKCCPRGQTGKHLCRQQCVRNNVSSFARAFSKNIHFCFDFLGNSLPSRNPEVATISPGFPSDSVKNRLEGTTDDCTGTGSNTNSQPSPNTILGYPKLDCQHPRLVHSIWFIKLILRMQGLYWSWKTRQVLEFYYGIFQDWKVLEKSHWSWKVLEIC